MNYRTLLVQIACIVLLAQATQAFAAVITVNSLDDDIDDDGQCTLREAIIAANDNATAGATSGECIAGDPEPTVDRIEFDGATTGTINIGSSLPRILEVAVLEGPGAESLAIDATNVTSGTLRILQVASSASGSTIAGLTFQNATTDTSSPLSIDSPTTIRDCVFQDNRSDAGGAVRMTRDLTIERSTFRRNIGALFGGGAVSLADAGRTLIVRDSLFEDNQALGRDGGAILVTGADNQVTISGSTFHANHAADDGGAVSIGGSTSGIENSTFIANSADRNGGAIELAGQSTLLANLTISANVADLDDDASGSGGGIVQQNPDAIITIRNSIVAGNASMSNTFDDCDGSFVSDGHNLIGNGAGCGGFTDGVNGDQEGHAASPIDPLLQALADNGGPTPTLAVEADSPAVAAGDPTGCAGLDGLPLTVDQRGGARPLPAGSRCDIGAFELDQPPVLFDLAVTIAGAGEGEVTSFPAGIDCPGDCSVDFLEDTVVDLHAQAAPGAFFAGWSGDCSGAAACQVTMDQARSVTAEFSATGFELSAAIDGNASGMITSSPAGIDCPGDCSEVFAAQQMIDLSAIAGTGAQFQNWAGDCTGSSACEVTLDAMRRVIAVFIDDDTLFFGSFE